MKRNLLLILSVLCFTGLVAQTAMDWTKTDCNGVSHNIFSELDSGFTIICEYVMVPTCQPCINAAGYLATIRDGYAISNPGKVRWYSTAYNNTYTCTQMNSWVSSNSLTPDADFIQGQDEVNYYGGMGMPTIVVLGGGTDHTVYYQHQGFTTSQVSVIEDAIDESLGLTGIEYTPDITSLNISVYPNPASDYSTVSYQLASNQDVKIELYNLVGAKVLSLPQGRQSKGSHEVVLDVTRISNGAYFLKVIAGDQVKVISFRVLH